jgi:hypothetical protein
MITLIGEMPVSRVIDYKRSKLTEPFYFQSMVLKELKLKYKIWIPTGFEMDWESVPFIRGTSKVSGLIHDYLCRVDSNPVVSKKVAAEVYKEFLIFRGTPWWKVQLKYWVVRFVPGYFHKLKT